MSKMKKVVLLLVVVAIVSALFITPVLAASPADTKLEIHSGTRLDKSFLFDFSPSPSGCLQYTTQTNEIEVVGAAKVRQNFVSNYNVLSTCGVNYYCFDTYGYETDVATTIVTIYGDLDNTYLMPYKAGYGQLGDFYSLAGYPGAASFTFFHVEGPWDSSYLNPQS